MDKNNLPQKLKDWRRRTADSEGIEPFRVFTNKVLENIAEAKPANREELLAIKGIRDKKFARYGKDILILINGDKEKPEFDKPFSVSKYLNLLNERLSRCRARIQGEISSLDIRERVIYFSLKDSEDESVINCLMWRSDYRLSGIEFEVGTEVILEGCPEVYKPTGRLSFKASSAELVGEGALKKAYDQLKKKLEAEGLFSELRKKQIPEFPQKIGLITAETGAVIHDFLTNLGRYGFQIKFMNSRVEGQGAIRDLIAAIDYFDGKDIDVLVIIRGGGSLESLQAFNNEALVRRIADFKISVICGIGHDKDIPLASLAADKAASTPTAVAVALNRPWEKVVNDISAVEKDMVYQYQKSLDAAAHRIESFSGELLRFFGGIFQIFEKIRRLIQNNLAVIDYKLRDARKMLSLLSKSLLDNLRRGIENNKKILYDTEKQLQVFNPARQLKLGYSIVSVSGNVVKTVKQVKVGGGLDIKVSDGNIKSVVNDIN